MARMDQELERLCRENPQEQQKVVITLSREAKGLTTADLGLHGAEPIGNLGIFKGVFSGRQLLELRERHEIEEITPDIEVGMFS